MATTTTEKSETRAEKADKVEKVEKVKVPAGEFEAYRVSQSGRFRGSDTKGSGFSGKEDSTIWFTQMNGKFVVAKVEYRNSYGERFTRELTAISYK